MNHSLKFGGMIEALSTRKDKTVRVTIGTQELDPATGSELFRLQNAFVYVVLKEEDFGRDEIEAIEALEAEFTDDRRKTSSQRLRSVLYRVWENDNKGHEGFNAFYLSEMERIIEHYKAKLP